MPKPMALQGLKEDLAFVEKQLAASAEPYDTLRLMWEQRREALQQDIARAQAMFSSRAEVALLFNGSPVVGAQEIKLDFAAKALENYQAVVASLASERAGAELGARGRLPSTFTSKLFIRDMVRGSVGFLIEEAQPDQHELVASPLKDAVDETTKILGDLSVADVGKFEQRVRELSPRTTSAIKKMAKVLYEFGAATKIVDDVQELNLDHERIASLHSRLSQVETLERPEKLSGVLLGLFPQRRQYEFQPSGDVPVIYGPVSETFDARYIAEPEFARSILMKPLVASFLVVSTLRSGVVQKEERTLQDVSIGSAPLVGNERGPP